MPTYTYRNTVTGEQREFIFSISEYEPTIVVEGEQWERDLEADLEETKIEDSEIWTGMKSRALGIHPDNIPAFVEASRRAGCPTTYDNKGNPEFRSRAHRKKYCKWRGAVDYEGGYGDST
jgi:hypothetical protein